MNMPTKLEREFYARNDVVQIGRDLLGKVLCTRIDEQVTRMTITETEAYVGEIDKASHAWGGRRTRRTEPIYGPPGHAYIYLCYGLHQLFNVVTNASGIPHAVLIRAGVPLEGQELMLQRRKKKKLDRTLLGGPGSVGMALGITTALTGADLLADTIWIEDHNFQPRPGAVLALPRVGVDYAEEDALLPYRFIAGEFD